MESFELFTAIIKIVSALAVTLGLMLVTLYLIKRFMKTKTDSTGRELIKVLDTKYLGPKKGIMLVDVLENVMVIGVSEHQISLLTEITDPESLKKMRDTERFCTSPDSFSHHLMQCRTRLHSMLGFAEKDKKSNV